MTDADRSVMLNLTAEDYVCANKLHSYHYSTRGFPLWFWLAMLVLALVTGFFPITLFPQDFPIQPVTVALWILALPFAMYFVAAPFAARRTYAKQKTLHQQLAVSWSEKGFRTANENGDWTVPWSSYLKRAENDKIFLFYQAPRLFNLLPKRVLSPAQVEDIRSCAAAIDET